MANLYKVGDKVRTAPNAPIVRLNGTVKYVACSLATGAGGKTCDKKTCAHMIKDNVWVLWPGQLATYSYHYSDLAYDAAQPPVSPTLPAASDMKSESTGDSKKDAFLDSAKKAIKEVITPKSTSVSEGSAEWWNAYKGFTTVKYDRQGRSFVRDTTVSPEPIGNENINWRAYHGYEKGSARKGP